jgi:hypothetical protein
MTSRALAVTCGLVVLVAELGSAQIRVQEDRPARRDRPGRRTPGVSLVAGPAPYDIGATGTGFAAALRFDLPSGRRFIIEPGLGYFRYTTQANAKINYLLPEVSVQYELASGSVRPFFGLGAGFAEFATGPGGSRGTVHAAAGLRAQSSGRVGFRVDARARSIDPFGSKGTMVELAAGLRLGLGAR